MFSKQMLTALLERAGARQLFGQTPDAPVDPINPSWASANPREAQAALTRKQYELFQKFYRPLEDEAINELLRDSEPEAQQAGAAVAKSYAGLDAMRDRQLRRYGVQMTPDAAEAVKRRQDLMEGLDVARAENSTRSMMEDMRLDGLGNMLGLMHGVSASASDNLGAAAGMQSSREAAGAVNRANARAARTQLVGTGLGLAIALGSL